MTQCSCAWTSRLLAALLASVLLPITASAAILSFTPPDSDIDDLDHHNVYAWKIWNINLSGQQITSARLTFNSLYNWDTNTNRLFLHLLDTARNPTAGNGILTLAPGTVGSSRITYFVDDPTNSVPVTDIDDAFIMDAGHNYASQPGWLIGAGTSDTFLTSRAFAGPGQAPTSAPGEALGAGWSVSSAGGGFYNYTYTFSPGQLGALASYISNGNDIAIGLDSDCHYFNNGIGFEIHTGTVAPEPALLLLIGGSVLVGLGRRYRRRQ